MPRKLGKSMTSSQPQPSTACWTSRTSHHVSLTLEDPTTKGQYIIANFQTFEYSNVKIARQIDLALLF